MQGANIIILAMIIGAMIAFDMGGPVNKVAFSLAQHLLLKVITPLWVWSQLLYGTPPIGLGLATFVQKYKF